MDKETQIKNLLESIQKNRIMVERKKHQYEEYDQDLLVYSIKQLSNHIQQKIQMLMLRIHILRFKYDEYRNYFDRVNIFIIILSTFLTILESSKNIFEVDESGIYALMKTFSFLPIFCSSTIAVTASILKFKKYQEKMERMQRCSESSITTLYKLKKLKEYIENSDTLKEFKKYKEEFKIEIYELYNKCQEDIERNLRYEDLVEQMEKYYSLNLQYKRSDCRFKNNIERLNPHFIPINTNSSCLTSICCKKKNNHKNYDIYSNNSDSIKINVTDLPPERNNILETNFQSIPVLINNESKQPDMQMIRLEEGNNKMNITKKN